MKSKALSILFLATILCFHLSPLYSVTTKEDKAPHYPPEKGYTINFDNAPVTELMRFLTKIGNINFIYTEDELAFNITMISEEPASLMDVMAAFIQILRVNGFDILEQGSNLVITRGEGMRQIATVVSTEVPLEEDATPPIMTRVFSVKNANPATLAGLIRPLLTDSAIIEVSETTRHIIITDITKNIQQVHNLFYTLDVPKASLDIDTYSCRNNSPETLISLANEILIPISDGNPLIFVPQDSTSTVFIVSTPFLIDQSLLILEDLDNPPSLTSAMKGPLTGKNILIHHIENKPADVLMEGAEAVKADLEKYGASSQSLITTLDSMKFIKQSHSLLFVGDPQSLGEVKGLLDNLDIPYSSKEVEFLRGEFYIYKIKNNDEEHISRSLEKLVQNLKSSPHPNPELIAAIQSMKYIKENDSLMFTGDAHSIEQLKQILPTFDVPDHEISKLPPSNQFFIYRPTHESASDLLKQVRHTYSNLKNSGLSDAAFLKALNSATLTQDKSALSFTGDQESLNRIRTLVSGLDQQQSSFFVYKPIGGLADQFQKEMIKSSKELAASGLTDPALIDAMASAKVVSNGTAVMFTGTPDGIEKLKEVIKNYDNERSKEPKASKFFIYKPLSISVKQLQEDVHKSAKQFETSGLEDPAFIRALSSAKIAPQGDRLIFTGTPDAIAQVEILVPSFDSPKEGQEKPDGKTTFVIYKVKYLAGPTLMSYLRNMGADLQRAGTSESDLITTLNNTRYVSETNTIIFTGTPQAVQEAVSLAQRFDIPALARGEAARAPSGYLIYKPKFVPGEELIHTLQDFEQNLRTSGVNNQGLFDVINNLKWMDRTSTILISGEENDTQTVFELLERFDVPGAATAEEGSGIETVSDTSFLIYKLQYHSGSEIEEALKLIGADLSKTKSQSNEALAGSIQTIQWLEVTNSLIATGTPDVLGKLKELIRSIDVPLKQVFVEILVIQTQSTDALEFGLHWGSQGNYRNKFSYGTYNNPINTDNNTDNLVAFPQALQGISATTTPQGSMIPIASGGDLGVIGDIILHKGQTYFALGSLVNALKNDGDTTVVMNQKIITQDNKMSTIFSGQNIPYTGSLVTNSGQNFVQTANLEYRDVGISLSITPVVGNNDVITLMIEEDISSVISTDQGDTSNPDQVAGITTSKNSTKVVVSVPDKSFLVLSGSINDSKARSRTGIPCLGGLPLIGAAFSDNQEVSTISNIVFFVRPQIIKSFDVYSEITTRQEEVFGGYGNEEDFDAGLELVKTPDDTY